jgi:predicted ribosome quality control (RQC) complex YloA/Tae2 family protein
MALDGIFLFSIMEELKEKILNAKVEKINQPEKDEILLLVNNGRQNYKLLISSSPTYPKIHLTNVNKTNPAQPPVFCMLLRKYLLGARIKNIRQLQTDRVAFIDFTTQDDLGFDSEYTMVVEIMGKHSNISLVRSRDNIVMDSIKHVTSVMNSVRCLFPGIEYIYPPASEKLDPFNLSKESLTNFIVINNFEVNLNFFSKVFTGVAKQFSKELFYRLENDKNQSLYSFCTAQFNKLTNKEFEFCLFIKDGSVQDFYCFNYKNLIGSDVVNYDSASSLLEAFYLEKDKMDRLNNRSSDLQKLLHVNLERCNKKIEILKETLEECGDKEKYRIYGELLTANIYNLKKGDSKAKLLNYYSEQEQYVDINLDIQKTPSQNIQAYFKKYNKLKKAEVGANLQIKNAIEEENYLQSVLTNIKNSEIYENIEDIRRELIDTGYIKSKTNSKIKIKPTKPMHFMSSDGLDIYVGRNNIQNDFLTLKFAGKNDLWLHTKNIPGSHVIIKSNGNIPDSSLLEGASLAAFYSKGKESSKVPVDYTIVKNVHKPGGAKPGMVIYYTNKTLYVDPVKPKITELKS